MENINKFLKIFIILIILTQSLLMLYHSQHRYFDFDEFQVLYASGSYIRGKAMYHDNIDSHFPLVNMFFFFLLKLFGFKTISLLAARLFVFLSTATGLFFAYKITVSTKDKDTGLLAVALALSSLTFVSKGIEIRHDVFNMLFNVISVYWIVRYIKSPKTAFLIYSGIFMGLALASTQKSAMWHVGIIGGIAIITFYEDKKKLLNVLLTYALVIPLPLIVSVLFLAAACNENILSFVTMALQSIGFLIPNVKATYSFPYSKAYIFGRLLWENGLFYLLSVIAVVFYFFKGLKTEKSRFLIVLWALAGLSFYLYVRRPFYQSFLPTVPALAILTAMLMAEMKRKLCTNTLKTSLYGLLIIIMLVMPSYLFMKKTQNLSDMSGQLENVSYCLENLKPQDKVLCFTQQQIFFDPLLRMGNNECGKSIFRIDADCFENKMIQDQCKLVINDHRTQFLNNAVKRKIFSNYVPVGKGDILSPGFWIQPGAEIEKNIWISGRYYSAVSDVEIDGRQLMDNQIYLEQQHTYLIHNPDDKPVLLLYMYE